MAIVINRDGIISSARGEVGYVETPRNITKFWRERKPSYQGAPWCGGFADWCWGKNGIDLRPYVNMYSASALRTAARKAGAYKTSGQKAGDIVLYGFGDSKLEHIGIAWPDPSAPGYRAIEGNTSRGSGGSQSNGGGVYVRYRGRKSIDGWVDVEKMVAYYIGKAIVSAAIEESTARPTGALDVDGRLGRLTAKEIQRRLGVTVDGRIGTETIKAWQRHEGMPVIDGVIDGQPRSAKELGNGVVPRVIKKGSNGSRLIRTVQTNLNKGGYGLKVDGKLGPDTVKALQTAMNKDAGALR